VLELSIWCEDGTLLWNTLCLFPLQTGLEAAIEWFNLSVWLAGESQQGSLWFLINKILTYEALLFCCRGCSAMQIFVCGPPKSSCVAWCSLCLLWGIG